MTEKVFDSLTEKKQNVDFTDYNRTQDDSSLQSSNVDEAYKLAGKVAITFTKGESDDVRRKIDKRIPVLCAAVYFSQFLDKTLLNYASITGLPIKGIEYNQVSAA